MVPSPSLTARLAIASCGVAGLAGLLVGVPLYRATGRLLEQSLQERAEAAAETISVALEGVSMAPGDRAALVDRLQDLAEESDLNLLTVADGGGLLIASTDPGLRAGEPDPLLVEADVPLSRFDTEDAATTPMHTDPAGRATVLAIAPLEDTLPPLYIAVRAPASWSAALDALGKRIAVAVLAWMAVAALLGALVTRRALRPLGRLAEAARSLAAGQSDEALPRSGAHEIDSLADDFDQMRRAIAGRERWLRGLAAAVAHEVRNPANALRLQLGLLRRSLSEDLAVAARFEGIEGELDRLEDTVNSLLAFAEGAPAVRAPTPLRRLLQDAAVGAEVEAPDVVVNVDATLMSRALANLVRNARQAGAARVVVSATVADGWLTVRAEDDGRGFPPVVAARALEPFARGDAGGSGLGLALVAAISRAHSGDTAIPSPGPGTTCVELRVRC